MIAEEAAQKLAPKSGFGILGTEGDEIRQAFWERKRIEASSNPGGLMAFNGDASARERPGAPIDRLSPLMHWLSKSKAVQQASEYLR